MWTLSDEALLAGLGSGDPEAAATFVNRFQNRVFGMTLSILRDRQAAEEAAQEAFVRAWRHASTYDPRKGTVAAWLLMIARNVSINMLPSHRPYPVDPEALLGLQDPSPSQAPGPSQDPGPPQDRDGQLAPVSEPMRQALMRLPAEQRRALVLAVFYGYTAREVSEQDGTPVGTVKTRIRAALMRLRSELGVSDER
jgi:RNA polymerase sigma-70 factor (ECF subfamily)